MDLNRLCNTWYDDGEEEHFLFACSDLNEHIDETICFRKRKIKLALVNRNRKWLKYRDKLRYLHSGVECNCGLSSTRAEVEYHWEVYSSLGNCRCPVNRMDTDARVLKHNSVID